MTPFVGVGASEQDIEDLFGGHICRCTGYRPMLCAFKTYAPTGNAAELLETPPYVMDENQGYGNGAVRHKNVTVVNVPIQPPPPQPQPVFKTTMMGSAAGPERPASPLPVIAPDAPMHTWYMPAPLSLAQLQSALGRGAYGQNYKLVVGNTRSQQRTKRHSHESALVGAAGWGEEKGKRGDNNKKKRKKKVTVCIFFFLSLCNVFFILFLCCFSSATVCILRSSGRVCRRSWTSAAWRS